MSERILLSHGSGGQVSHDLIRDLFVAYFDNPILLQQTDSAILEHGMENLAFTTDAYVIDPLFFPGGDIGKLAICGTVNDLAVAGAVPAYISVGFIIEEGFALEDLERIVVSMKKEAELAGVTIVTGDTKVVDHGKADKLFINTSGIGMLLKTRRNLSLGRHIIPGDKILVNGTMGDHGIAVMAERENLELNSTLQSDCASLNHLIQDVLSHHKEVKMIRDITRGGLGTILCELTKERNFGIAIREEAIPVDEQVKGVCEILGLEPLYVANEGKFLMITGPEEAEAILETIRSNPLGKQAAVIGEVIDFAQGQVLMETVIGGKRIIEMLSGEQLPRIC